MIRLLTSADVEDAFALSNLAGWNQTRADWQLLLNLEPEACFGIDADGRLAATTTLVCYGQDLAWTGMVLVHADFRGRGFARQLISKALELARRRGVRTIQLDATDMGRPLYSSFGFRDEQPIERWTRSGPGSAGGPLGIQSSPDLALDQRAFGADRSRVLTNWLPTAVMADGFAFTREGARYRYLGPCVAETPEAAATMIRASLPDGSCCWDLLPGNGSAVTVAESLGFEPNRRLMRMILGPAHTADYRMIYAIAGFEFG